MKRRASTRLRERLRDNLYRAIDIYVLAASDTIIITRTRVPVSAKLYDELHLNRLNFIMVPLVLLVLRQADAVYSGRRLRHEIWRLRHER